MHLRALLAIALTFAATSQLSCKLNDYCLECQTGDAGHGDGSADAPTDGSGDASNCVPSGPEICDGKDNDCNGMIDDGVLPQVGDPCQNQAGECAGGVIQCAPTTPGDQTTDMLSCTKKPSPEICDGKDNDCNGQIDNGNPLSYIDMNGMLQTAPAKCGSGVGECVQGNNICQNGAVVCQGAISGTTETCNGKDDDCDGTPDEGLSNLGTCGQPEPGCATYPNMACGECKIGTLSCVGGGTVCMGAVNPTFEICDGKDNDCDGVIDNGYNKLTDPQNCGMCGHICGANLPNGGEADWACSNGACVIASCKAGYHDNNNSPADGCEFGPCFSSGAEVCDGVDNDCDGTIDEQLGTPPAICATQGECAGTTAACMGSSGWVCNYGPNVSTDANGNIVPETKCDGLDNDCDGTIDNNQPQVAHLDGTPANPQACHDSGLGVCEGTGVYHCDDGSFAGSTPGGNLNGPALCDITTPGATPSPESCNNLDDDCDGVVDNGASTGSLVGQDWVDIGGGHQMMKYEASRPDADSADPGSVSKTSCSSHNISATGATETGSTATYTTTTAHGLSAGKVVTIAGVGAAGYNGTYQVTSIVSTTRFTVTLPVTGLATSGGGTVSSNCVATCSKANALPWTNVTYLQALAACQSVGATLCTESQWHRACSAQRPSTYPLSTDGTGLLIEAEDYYGISNASDGTTTRAWAEDETPGFFGTSDLQALPNNGGSISAANAPTQSPRLDYQVNFTAIATNYHVCVHMLSPSTNDNTIFVGISTTLPGSATSTITTSSNGVWQWRGTGNISVPAIGNRFVSIYMGKDGTKVDALYIGTGNCPGTITDNNGPGGTWSYAANPTTYQATVCNGHDYDANADATLPSGTAGSCIANFGTVMNPVGPNDMSGNVKEWTMAHVPGENPIRGGAASDTSIGIDCALNFTLGDDTFFFPDVGFRCCR